MDEVERELEAARQELDGYVPLDHPEHDVLVRLIRAVEMLADKVRDLTDRK
jgi:hypothetical protein